MSFRQVTGLSDGLVSPALLSAQPDTQYLSLTKEGKRELIKFKFSNAKTVGEAQGKTYKNVVVYRHEMTKAPIYEDEQQFIVAISRHTDSFQYASRTTAYDDLLKDALLAGGSPKLIPVTPDMYYQEDESRP